MQFDNPLIVQSDRTLLLDVHAPRANDCRNALIPFAELERSPEHLHTYRLTPLSLWNASGAGFTAQKAIDVLKEFSRYDVPQSVEFWITETAGRFGKLRLTSAPSVLVPYNTAAITNSTKASDKVKEIREEYLYLTATSQAVYKEIGMSQTAKKYLEKVEYESPDPQFLPKEPLSDIEKECCFRLHLTDRGTIKQELLHLGWPVKDDVPLADGEPLKVNLRDKTLSGKEFKIRDYQKSAAQALVGDKGPGTGFGTIVMPCGAGKTVVGMTVMDLLKTRTLIITTNISAVHQWISELLDKTDLTKDDIAEYTGENKTIKPVTVATYQILTWRPVRILTFHFSATTTGDLLFMMKSTCCRRPYSGWLQKSRQYGA